MKDPVEEAGLEVPLLNGSAEGGKRSATRAFQDFSRKENAFVVFPIVSKSHCEKESMMYDEGFDNV